jgi:hypothetical protein
MAVEDGYIRYYTRIGRPWRCCWCRAMGAGVVDFYHPRIKTILKKYDLALLSEGRSNGEGVTPIVFGVCRECGTLMRGARPSVLGTLRRASLRRRKAAAGYSAPRGFNSI